MRMIKNKVYGIFFLLKNGFLTDFWFSYRFPVFLPISGFLEILKKYSINQYKDIYVSMIVE